MKVLVTGADRFGLKVTGKVNILKNPPYELFAQE